MTPITHRRVLRIAAPIVLSNATVPLLGAVDVGVVGQMGQAAPIGAVALGAVLLGVIYWGFGFLRMGTSGLAAQAQGAGDMAERGAILLRALMIAAAAGLVLVVLQGVMLRGAFALSPASAQVEGLARQYLGIRIWGAPATIALFAVTGWLIALERTRAVLVIQVVMNGLNVGHDLWFVLHLGWGVPGVATATLIAEWSGLALGLWLCRDAFGPVLRAAWARVGDRAALWLMFTVNRDILIRSMALQLCYVTFVFLGARFGDVTLAANQVLMLFLELTAYALDGFAFAAEALVGQAIGARLPAQTRRAAGLTSQWGVGGAVLMGLTFWLAGPAIIDLMTTAPDVRAESRTYLLWVAAAPVIGISAWMLDGIFIGATLTQAMRRAALQSVAVYAVAVMVLVPGLGNHGLWAALMVLNVTRAITLGLRFSQVAAKASGADQPERH